jgi:hypothetical protein
MSYKAAILRDRPEHIWQVYRSAFVERYKLLEQNDSVILFVLCVAVLCRPLSLLTPRHEVFVKSL